MFVFGLQSLIVTVSVMGAAIWAYMNSTTVISARYNHHVKLASQTVAAGIPLSMPVLCIIHLLLQQLQ